VSAAASKVAIELMNRFCPVADSNFQWYQGAIIETPRGTRENEGKAAVGGSGGIW
jgi:hypothetical protein